MGFASRLASLVLVLVSAVSQVSFAESIPIAGQVIADGEPAPGVAVRLLPAVGRHNAGELRLTGTPDLEPEDAASSDTAGRFELTAPDAGFWRLRFELAGWVPRELRLEPLLYATELGDIELESDAGLRVKFQAGGKPTEARVVAYPIDREMSRKAGRTVRLAQPGGGGRLLFTDRAGERGEVRIPANGLEKAWVLEAVSDGFVPLRHQVTGRPRKLELDLERGVRRQLRTVNADGEPVDGVLLFAGDGYLPLAKTGDGGNATLTLPEDGGLTLTAIGPRGRYGSLHLQPLTREVTEEATEEAVGAPEIITLLNPRTISGLVVEQGSREPIDGALVWAGTANSARTDAHGVYSVRLPPPDSAMDGIAVRAATADHVASGEPAPLQGTAGPTITLAPTGRLSGRVIDAEGTGLAGVGIAYQSVPGGSLRFRRLGPEATRHARSAVDGRFELVGLAAGRDYRLRLVKAGFAPHRLRVPPLKPFERRTGVEMVLNHGRRGFGRVVAQDELPIAGALVRLAAPAEPRRQKIPTPEAEDQAPQDTTGIDGRFTLDDLAPGSYDLKVSSPGFGPVSVPGVEVPAGAGEIDLGTVSLPPGVAIEGQVVDAEGQPLAGVEIRAAEASRRPMPATLRLRVLTEVTPTLTGADGNFSVADRLAGERLDLIVAGEGHVAQTVTGVVAPPDEPLRVVLQQVSRVRGRVIDDQGIPIAGADVEVHAEGLAGSGQRRVTDPRLTRAAADGHFELLDVEPGKVTVAARAKGYQVTRLSGLDAPAGGELQDVELVLPIGATIVGSMMDANDGPVAGVDVMVSADGRARPEAFAVTDGDGRFQLWGVGLGRRTVSARAEDGRQTSKSVNVEVDGLTVELRFDGGIEVSGRVIDTAGTGLAGATVWLAVNARVPRKSVSETTSTADGSFIFKGVTADSYRLMAFKPGYADAMRPELVAVATTPVRGLEIQLDQGLKISGQILGLGIDDLARVEVRGGGRTGKVDFEGGYSIEQVPPGPTIVTAAIRGSGRAVRQQITVETGAGEVILDLEFGGGLVLSGIVVVGEQPVVGASLNLIGAAGASTGGRATTDQQGRFRIEGLETGGYRLMVRSLASGVWHRQEIELVADDDVRIQIGSSRAAGRVRDRVTGDGIADALVSLTATGAATELGDKSATSDSRGYFSFAAVPEGSWLLRASKAGYAAAETAFSLHFGEVVEDLDVLLGATSGLAFEVVSAIGTPPARVQVAVLDAAGQRQAGGAYQTLESGRVELATVPEGNWEMLIAAGDSAVTSLRVTAPGDAGRAQLSPGGGLRVVVPELAEGLVDATVKLIGPDGRPHRGLSWNGEVLDQYLLRGGRVIVSNLMPGAWTVQVRDADGRTWSVETLVPLGAPMTVTLP